MNAVEANEGDQVDFGFIGLVDAPVHMHCVGMKFREHRSVAAAYRTLVGEDRRSHKVEEKEENLAASRVELLVVGQGAGIEEGWRWRGYVVGEEDDDRKSHRINKDERMAVGVVLQVRHALEDILKL